MSSVTAWIGHIIANIVWDWIGWQNVPDLWSCGGKVLSPKLLLHARLRTSVRVSAERSCLTSDMGVSDKQTAVGQVTRGEGIAGQRPVDESTNVEHDVQHCKKMHFLSFGVCSLEPAFLYLSPDCFSWGKMCCTFNALYCPASKSIRNDEACGGKGAWQWLIVALGIATLRFACIAKCSVITRIKFL